MVVAGGIGLCLTILGYRARRVLHSTAFAIALLLSGFLIYQNMTATTTSDIVLSSISHINCTCIFFTLIISFLHNMFVRKASMDGHNNDENDGELRLLFVPALLLLLLISAASNLAEHFTVSQCIIAAHTFLMHTKALLYCALVRRTKSQIDAVSERLRNAEINRRRTQVSQLREISVIYDRVLERISLLNGAFSSLLSCAFSK
jgi:hypothetical protein